MAKWAKTLIPSAVGIACLVLLSMAFTNHRTGHTNSETSGVANAETLERETHISLPLGSSRSMVERFLGQRGIECSFDASSQSVHAIARNLNGSTSLVDKSLALQFHFDDASKLKSVDAKVLFTGP